MNRILATVAMMIVLFGAACSDDDGNSPQRTNTGDTLERPTSSGPPSTTKP